MIIAESYKALDTDNLLMYINTTKQVEKTLRMKLLMMKNSLVYLNIVKIN